jgi:drug/metabolite transporter (DMT)-like permease
MGSLVGFTAYVWLLQVSTPARVSTYAYVNPLIAVLLGRLVLNEPFPKSLALAAGLILGAVILTTAARMKKEGRRLRE